MSVNVPVVNAGLKYVNGLILSYLPAPAAPYVVGKVMSMGAGAARNSTDENDIILDSEVIINGLVVGANGMDSAVMAADKMYAVYVIADSKKYEPVAGLLSLDPVRPNLPFNYDMFRRVGWVRTSAASLLLPWWQYGQDQERMYYYDSSVLVLAAGASAVLAGVPLAVGVGASLNVPAVPPVDAQVLLDVGLSAAGLARFAPHGSSSAAGIVRVGSSAVGTLTMPAMVPTKLNSGVPTVQYAVSAGTLALSVVGFVDSLY